jgi:membrane protease YdiL (CAAX protease family)
MESNRRNWTWIGLAIALFGLPAVVAIYNWQVATPSDATIALREVVILALTGLLLWIVVKGERLPLSSIGLSFDRPGRSLLRGLGLLLVIFAAVVAILAAYSALGIKYGEGGRIAPSLWVTLLTVFRAGLSEEILYRGFGLERLETLTGNKWLAAGIVILLFAAFHYRQGLAGVFIALVLGTILTAFYLWKRDLLAAIIAHFLVDFIPNVALPLLGAGD